MAKRSNTYMALGVVLIASALAGCASSGTAKPLTAADAALLPGVWQGTVTAPGGSARQPGTLTVRPDGTYTTEAGAFSSTGKLEIKDGVVHFVSTSGTGALGAGQRSGTASLRDQTTSWVLEGAGRGAVAGPYNFTFSKAK
jgi:hypothetical protein